jgi:hypothetical protein
MLNTKRFAELSAEARRDPARRARIEAARARTLEEIARYRLAELCQAPP